MRLHRRDVLRLGLVAVGATAAELALAGCSSSPASPAVTASADSARLAKRTKVTLLLDYTVYSAHVGIFEALHKGYYAADGIDLDVIQPSDANTALKLVQAGKADIGLATPADMITADTKGSSYTTFMSIVGGNLEGIAVLGKSGITSAAQLAGKTIGASGAQKGLVSAQITGAGGDPAKSKFIDTGLDFMANLTAGTIDAAAVFKPDVSAAKSAGADVRFIPMGLGGGLAFPSLIAYANTSAITSDAAVLKAFTAATIRGYEDAIKDPKGAADTTAQQNPGVKAAPLEAEVELIKGDFVGKSGKYGYVDEQQIADLRDFMIQNKAVVDPPAASSISTDSLMPA